MLPVARRRVPLLELLNLRHAHRMILVHGPHDKMGPRIGHVPNVDVWSSFATLKRPYFVVDPTFLGKHKLQTVSRAATPQLRQSRCDPAGAQAPEVHLESHQTWHWVLEGPSIIYQMSCSFKHLGGSINGGTPKSSILVRFSLKIHPAIGVPPICGNLHLGMPVCPKPVDLHLHGQTSQGIPALPVSICTTLAVASSAPVTTWALWWRCWVKNGDLTGKNGSRAQNTWKLSSNNGS